MDIREAINFLESAISFRSLGTCGVAWQTLKTFVSEQTAHNPSSLTCLCKESGLHLKSTVGGAITAASLSVVINKDCPIHGHYMQS